MRRMERIGARCYSQPWHGVETFGGAGDSLVKGVVVKLSAIALSASRISARSVIGWNVACRCAEFCVDLQRLALWFSGRHDRRWPRLIAAELAASRPNRNFRGR
jgi:hypothetical protein